jgi:hypothetical protein
MGMNERFRGLTARAALGLVLATGGCASDVTENATPLTPHKVSISFDSFSSDANMRHLLEQLARYASACEITDAQMIPQAHNLSLLELTTKEEECKPGAIPEIPQQTIPEGATIYNVGKGIFVVRPDRTADSTRAGRAGRLLIEQNPAHKGLTFKSVSISFTEGGHRGTILIGKPKA